MITETTNLKQLLECYNPQDDAELSYKKAIMTFLDQYANAFERSLDVGHITASCWLVNKDNSKALLTHHKKLGKWFQLGGHCDGETDALAVAIKEAQEESGIIHIVPVHCAIFDIDVHLIPENKKERAHYHYDIRFFLQVQSDEDIIVGHESHDLAWISKDRSQLPTDELSVTRMFDKWLDY